MLLRWARGTGKVILALRRDGVFSAGGTSVYFLQGDSVTMRRILILQTSTGACSTRRPILTRQPAGLTLIGRLGASLILVSSKTRSEMEPLRRRLNNQHPFIVENGGAVFIPQGTFPFPIEQASAREGYEVVEIGTPYAQLRTALNGIQKQVGCRLRGFGDLSLEGSRSPDRLCQTPRRCTQLNGNMTNRSSLKVSTLTGIGSRGGGGQPRARCTRGTVLSRDGSER